MSSSPLQIFALCLGCILVGSCWQRKTLFLFLKCNTSLFHYKISPVSYIKLWCNLKLEWYGLKHELSICARNELGFTADTCSQPDALDPVQPVYCTISRTYLEQWLHELLDVQFSFGGQILYSSLFREEKQHTLSSVQHLDRLARAVRVLRPSYP